jgi:hypothetical protein
MSKRKITTLTALFCTTCLCSGVSLATSNFNGSNGILLIPDVNVNGNIFYDSVTLQLDLSKGTFSVVNAQPKNTKISDKPLDTYTAEGYSVGFLGCASSGTNEITCYLRVVNNQADRKLTVYGDWISDYRSRLFDNLNNTYNAASITVANGTDNNYVETTLIQGVPTNVSMVFKNIDIHAKSIAAFKPSFMDKTSNRQFQGNFINIKF